MEGSRRRGDELPRGDDPEVVARYESAVDLVALAVRQITAGGRLQGERSELEAWGREGLLDAARRFDPSRGIGFRTFAYYRVRGAILDGLRKMGTWSRRGYERVLLLRAAQSTSEGAYEDYLAARGDLSAELESLLRSSVDELPPPEDEIIRRHYFDGESLEKVGGSLGLSKSWASRLHTRAIRRLTLRLRQLPTGELCSTPGRSAGRTTGRGGR